MLERVYPGVFLTEVAFESHPIEGVPTSSPDWTGANAHDPGISLLQLFAWSAESLVYRANTLAPPHIAATQLGVASGLHVGAADAPNQVPVSVTPGLAVTPDGQVVERRVPLLLRVARHDGSS